MFPDLNASVFTHSDVFYDAEFEDILSKMIACYHQMIADKLTLINNENSIRDIMLYNYLKNQEFKVKHQLTNYLFDPELPENTGRIDIRIMPVNPFINDDAYYVIECKRLDAKTTTGTSGLNGEYIGEGICRFVSEKYSSYYKVNGMIGFVVEPVDLHNNVTSINSLLTSHFPHAKTTGTLIKKELTGAFDFSYYSTHSCTSGTVTIYHLMFDFSKNVA
jgi:hypothetical protein